MEMYATHLLQIIIDTLTLLHVDIVVVEVKVHIILPVVVMDIILGGGEGVV